MCVYIYIYTHTYIYICTELILVLGGSRNFRKIGKPQPINALICIFEFTNDFRCSIKTKKQICH